jgi:putative hydrolase of the HAD superfamily
MKITSISFDFWNTIYEDHKHSYERHKERVKYLGDALVKNGYKQYADASSSLNIEESFKYCWDYFDKIWKNEHRTLNAKELLKIGLDYLKADLPENEFNSVADFFGNILLKYPPEIFEGAKEVIPQLTEKYKLGITSDTAYTSGKVLKQLLEKDGLLKYFSGFTYSDEAGCSKPDPKMFRSTMLRLGSKAHETIHVGDNEYTDIQGAKEEGLKTMLFTGGLKDKNVNSEADYRVDSWKELLEVLKFV